jgi:hypothetical protein
VKKKKENILKRRVSFVWRKKKKPQNNTNPPIDDHSIIVTPLVVQTDERGEIIQVCSCGEMNMRRDHTREKKKTKFLLCLFGKIKLIWRIERRGEESEGQRGSPS